MSDENAQELSPIRSEQSLEQANRLCSLLAQSANEPSIAYEIILNNSGLPEVDRSYYEYLYDLMPIDTNDIGDRTKANRLIMAAMSSQNSLLMSGPAKCIGPEKCPVFSRCPLTECEANALSGGPCIVELATCVSAFRGLMESVAEDIHEDISAFDIVNAKNLAGIDLVITRCLTDIHTNGIFSKKVQVLDSGARIEEPIPNPAIDTLSKMVNASVKLQSSAGFGAKARAELKLRNAQRKAQEGVSGNREMDGGIRERLDRIKKLQASDEQAGQVVQSPDHQELLRRSVQNRAQPKDEW
mgnify:CR=1 FL=1